VGSYTDAAIYGRFYRGGNVGNKPSIPVNRIIHGDCIDVMSEFPDNCIDLVVTSPPYNVGIPYDEYVDKKEWAEYYSWCEKWLSQLYRILKNDGRCCINHYIGGIGDSEYRTPPLMEINTIATHKVGFNHNSLAVWTDRTLTKRTAWGSWRSASAPYISSPFEGILILYKDTWRKNNGGETEITPSEFMRACSGVWNIRPETDNNDNPAPFPIELPERCIKLLSYKDDIVIDPFVGGGTTAVAAKRLDRRYIGIDISKNYCRIARHKIANIPSMKLEQFDKQRKLEVKPCH